jgi:hypothetical protein
LVSPITMSEGWHWRANFLVRYPHCVQWTVTQSDQKVSVHLMFTVQNMQKYFKQFQSLTITQLELRITDGVSVSLEHSSACQ